MKPLLTHFLVALVGWSVCFQALSAGHSRESRRKQMIQDVEVIKHHFEAAYAPMSWKQAELGFDLELAFENAKSQILATPNITTKQFQRIVRQFVNTAHDYHVDALFYSTEAASLPFSIRGAEGRYFIDWIDPLRLSSTYYPVQVGDELLTFDQRPIAEVINELMAEIGKNSNPKTDRRLAEIKLTQRIGATGDLVPKGTIMLSTRSSTTRRVETFQLHWSYTPERVANPLDFLQSLSFLSGILEEAKEESTIEIPKLSMANPLHEACAARSADRAGGLGAKRSFVPNLGEMVWTIDDQPLGEDEEPWDWPAYVYRHPNGKAIGYIRIPHYHDSNEMAEEFGEILNLLQEKTDALVIDQLHNYGGFVDYMYVLASMVAIEPMQAPYHRIKITQKEALKAYSTIELIKTVELLLNQKEMEQNEKPKKKEGDNPKDEGKDKKKEDDQVDQKESKKKKEDEFNYQVLMFLKAYHELILEEWNRGELLTRPTPILGTDHINPHPKYRYTKPIVILIDEMDFSGADFMPAILQDNRRALLFGTKTAGAGGFITAFTFPNTNGIALCSYTGSVAQRSDMRKIENVGISPDISYEITASDIQEGYQGYVKAVNQAVQRLLDK